MSKFGKELIQSLTEAVEHAEGKADSARVVVARGSTLDELHQDRLKRPGYKAAYDALEEAEDD